MKKALLVLGALTVVLSVVAAANGKVQRLITGRDIRNNSVSSADIKNGTIVRKDISRRLAGSLRGPRGRAGRNGARGARGPTGAAGAKGATGAAGAAGVAGVNGKSAFDQVPAGVTVHGVVGLDVDAAQATGGDWGTLETMGMPGSAVLEDDDVFVNCDGWEDIDPNNPTNTPPTTCDTNAGCIGTPAAPTAPAGKVCIYVLHSDNADDLLGFGVGSNQGFKLNFTNLVVGDAFVDATWAYKG